MRVLLRSLVLVAAVAALSAAPDVAAVRVWQGSMEIPTYSEGPPNPNAPFDLFSYGRFNYPYPLRDALTNRRESVIWRTLHLENEYLRLTVLPDLGGHIYSCLDKRSGREMFYANTAIKKALIGYRGAWAAFGVEFNFPVSHNWVSMSPVDFATAAHPDGSGSVWIGNVDQVYGAQWRVELRLQPGRAVLEQHTDLYNASDVRHRYYWWNNAAVQVWEDSRLVYPTELMATHGFTRIEPWPVDTKGRDMSVIRNQADGPVSLFTYGTREGFVGVYHPHTNSGTVHVAAPEELPTHKVWSWGYDRDAADWRTALSDDESGYVELQSGLFRNQETYAFLEPQETVRFAESWIPVRDLGGITRANADAVLNIDRPDQGKRGHVRLALDVTRDLPGARIIVRDGAATAIDRSVSLSPRQVWRGEFDQTTTGVVVFELTDSDGHVVLRHTENVFDRMPAASGRIGPQANLRASGTATGADDIARMGQTDELEGRRLIAMSRYEMGLRQHPESLALLKAAGRLAVTLGWPDAGADGPRRAIDWLEAARARNTTDVEVEYYLGTALAAAGRTAEARPHLEAARRFRATRPGATLQLARLSAREDNAEEALRELKAGGLESPYASLMGGMEVALLRRLGREAEARERAHQWRAIDPANSLLRYELTLNGEQDETLWAHLGADANRVLDLVDRYLAIGGYRDALALLDRAYPAVSPPAREAGAVLPGESPLIAYYRGYVRALAGGRPDADYRAASALPTTYVFPSRRSSFAVLRSALQANPDDQTARFLLGSLYLATGLFDPAIESWQRVRRAHANIPTLHRNLGLALLQGSTNYKEARAVLEEGTTVDKGNVEVYVGLDGVLSAAGASARERVDALRRFPARDDMPAPLVFKLALALAEAGDAASAEQLFHNRFFPREEGGTNVRSVYAQVRLTSARLAAGNRHCGEALEVLQALPREQTGLAFTAGGLADAIAPAFMVQQVAEVEAACGRRESAHQRWEQLARALGGDAAPLSMAIADAARVALGRARTAAERARLERALESATATLESAGTSNPGLTELARASLLAALGRPRESRESFRRVFQFPDRGLSHALARTALSAPATGRRP